MSTTQKKQRRLRNVRCKNGTVIWFDEFATCNWWSDRDKLTLLVGEAMGDKIILSKQAEAEAQEISELEELRRGMVPLLQHITRVAQDQVTLTKSAYRFVARGNYEAMKRRRIKERAKVQEEKENNVVSW